MLNLDLINGLSFTKGCYPGQEIVARMKYLGKSKRRMYRIAIPHFSRAPRRLVHLSPVPKTLEAGTILNATLNPDGYVEALAVMKIAETTQALTLGEYKVQLASLPYSLADEAV